MRRMPPPILPLAPIRARPSAPVAVAIAAAFAGLAAMSRIASATPAPIAPGVFVERDTFAAGEQPDGNSVLFSGPAGWVVFDTGRHVAHTRAVADFIQATPGAGSAVPPAGEPLPLPLRAVVNSHWHLDHLGGNAWLRAHVPGTRVYASEAVAPALSGWLADSRRDMQAMLDAPAGQRPDAATQAMLRGDIALIDQGPALLPDVVVSGPRTLDDAGRPLQIGHEGPAATAADLWLYDPTTRVLAVGDLVTLPAPFLDTACAPGWRAALAHVAQVPFTTLVPGHGAPMSRDEFGTWRRAFEGLLDCAAATGPTTAACSAGWVSALGALLPADHHEKAARMATYYVDQHLRATPAKRDRYCAAAAGAARPAI